MLEEMNLSAKVIFILVMYCVISISIIFMVNSFIINDDFGKIENENHAFEIMRAKDALNDHFTKNETIVNDWAMWDDAYNFVLGKNPEFIESNVTKELYSELEIRDIVILDIEGNLLFSRSYDYVLSEDVELNEDIRDYAFDLKNGSGLYYSEDKIYDITVSEITDSSKEKSPNGFLVFADIINEEDINSINKNYNTSINLEGIFIKDQNNNNIVTTSDSKEAFFSVNINNMFYELVFKMPLSTKVSEIGEETLIKSTLFTLLIIFTLGVIFHFILRMYVLEEIKKLGLTVKEIIHTKDLDRRVNLSSTEEFRLLQKDINIMLGIIQDSQEKLHKLANHDYLTGLINRRGCYDRLDVLMREKETFHIVFLDIDGLKSVNDTYGHDEGDQLIKKITERIVAKVQDEDMICRVGGDEFVIICKGSDCDNTINKMNIIATDLELLSVNSQYNYSISWGIALNEQSKSVDELIERADQRMYKQKINKKRK